MDKLRLFRNLMLMAAVDGKMTQEEVVFLALRSNRWGISEAEFQETLQLIQSHQLGLEIPADPVLRREMLRDMLRMMAVDGELSESERGLFALASATMGIEREELNALIDSVVEDS